MLTSRRMRWTGRVEPVGGEKGCIGFCWEIVTERDHLGELGADRSILRWIFRKEDVVAWTGLIRLRVGTDGRHLLT
jgi:hypothetical protein